MSQSSVGEILYTESEAPFINKLIFYEPKFSHEEIRDTYSYNSLIEITDSIKHNFYILTQFGEILCFDYKEN